MVTLAAIGRVVGSNSSRNPDSRSADSAGVRPISSWLRRLRSLASRSSVWPGSSRVRCSTAPVEVMRTMSTRSADSPTSSRCRIDEEEATGYCMIAT